MSAFLIYTSRASRALQLAEALEGLAIVYPGDAKKAESALVAGGTVVATLEAFNGDIRYPEGSKLMFTPDCPAGTPGRSLAEARGMVCGCVIPDTEDEVRVILTLRDLLRNAPDPYGVRKHSQEEPDYGF